jgi:hypothetical protein
VVLQAEEDANLDQTAPLAVPAVEAYLISSDTAKWFHSHQMGLLAGSQSGQHVAESRLGDEFPRFALDRFPKMVRLEDLHAATEAEDPSE